MSGICGIFNLDGSPAGRASLERMLIRIRHRGPDGQGVWCSGVAGLAQCTLRTTTESIHERQPLLSEQTDLILVADARIDNRSALIKSLALVDRGAEEISDGYLISKAYQAWGEDCPQKLDGDFAFAIWDGRQHRLFCARDAAGVKPFYYHLSAHKFVFASEIKALLAQPDVPRRLNEGRVADYLLWSFEDTRDTFYEDIFRLPPACSLTIGSDGGQPRKYWVLDPDREIHFAKDEEYVQAFREVFYKAVRSRARSAYPLGSALSGGLDSSSIACTARSLLIEKNCLPLKVFSAVFPSYRGQGESNIDESYYIDRVLASGGFEPHYVQADKISPLIDPQRLNAVLDEPYFAPTLFLFWGLYNTAQQTGVRVLLDGTDGDRTISHGEAHLADLARAGKWRTLWREADAMAKVRQGSSGASPLVWQYGFRPLVPPALVDFKRRIVSGRVERGAQPNALVRMDFMQRVGYADRMRASSRSRYLTARHKHFQELNSGINALSLELFDKASAAFSVEVRFPFYDRRLMEFCLALPAELKLSRGWTRYILRAAMQGSLPEEVQWRTHKTNLFSAFNKQFSVKELPTLEAKMPGCVDILNDFVNRDELQTVFRRYCSSPADRLADAYTLFGVINLTNWLQQAGFR